MGWASKRNGELLALAAAEFDVFLTVDRNLDHHWTTGVTGRAKEVEWPPNM